MIYPPCFLDVNVEKGCDLSRVKALKMPLFRTANTRSNLPVTVDKNASRKQKKLNNFYQQNETNLTYQKI